MAMTIHVYVLGLEAVLKIDGCKERKMAGQPGLPIYDVCGVILRQDDGRWMFPLSDLENRIPAGLVEFVDEISVRDNCSLVGLPKREAGRYVHKSAVAEVCPASERQCPVVRIRSKNMEDARELLHKIMVGSILPEESYEKPQIAPSHEWLKKQSTRLGQLSARMSVALTRLRHKVRRCWWTLRQKTINCWCKIFGR